MSISTADQLFHASGLGRCELIRGELHRMNAAGGEHGRIAATLTCLLGGFVMKHKLGTIYAAETGFTLARDPDTVRAPDFAFIRAERDVSMKSGFVPGAPDLAVEVLSPDDRPGYVREKIAEWLESGALAVWIVHPRKRNVTIHQSECEATTFSENDVLAGGAMFPGFELVVRDLFV
jgi:Uma2 family endonuclease